jgi:hypothetical protein
VRFDCSFGLPACAPCDDLAFDAEESVESSCASFNDLMPCYRRHGEGIVNFSGKMRTFIGGFWESPHAFGQPAQLAATATSENVAPSAWRRHPIATPRRVPLQKRPWRRFYGSSSRHVQIIDFPMGARNASSPPDRLDGSIKR